MTDVLIAGVGMTPVGEHWDISLRELAYLAVKEARQDAGQLMPEAVYVGNMLASIISSQAHVGALATDCTGLTGAEACTVEAGGASGGAALRLGYMAIASGQVNVALVLGMEKLTDMVGPQVEAALQTGLDSDFEAIHGLTPNSQAALLMQRYLYEYRAPRRAFGGFPINAHANGALNPKAMFRSAISAETYENAGITADPLNLYDIAPVADGAAALILTRADLLPKDLPHRRVRISGSGMANDRLALHDRPDPLAFDAVRVSIDQACRRAGIRAGEVDLFELYDAYSLYAALTLEAAGFTERGQGWKLAQDGKIGLQGFLPLSTFGGLKARGNPGGATGVYQAVEAALQLRGEAGSNQVKGAERALIQCLGGPAATAVAHVLEVMPASEG